MYCDDYGNPSIVKNLEAMLEEDLSSGEGGVGERSRDSGFAVPWGGVGGFAAAGVPSTEQLILENRLLKQALNMNKNFRQQPVPWGFPPIGFQNDVPRFNQTFSHLPNTCPANYNQMRFNQTYSHLPNANLPDYRRVPAPQPFFEQNPWLRNQLSPAPPIPRMQLGRAPPGFSSGHNLNTSLANSSTDSRLTSYDSFDSGARQLFHSASFDGCYFDDNIPAQHLQKACNSRENLVPGGILSSAVSSGGDVRNRSVFADFTRETASRSLKRHHQLKKTWGRICELCRSAKLALPISPICPVDWNMSDILSTFSGVFHEIFASLDQSKSALIPLVDIKKILDVLTKYVGMDVQTDLELMEHFDKILCTCSLIVSNQDFILAGAGCEVVLAGERADVWEGLI